MAKGSPIAQFLASAACSFGRSAHCSRSEFVIWQHCLPAPEPENVLRGRGEALGSLITSWRISDEDDSWLGSRDYSCYFGPDTGRGCCRLAPPALSARLRECSRGGNDRTVHERLSDVLVRAWQRKQRQRSHFAFLRAPRLPRCSVQSNWRYELLIIELLFVYLSISSIKSDCSSSPPLKPKGPRPLLKAILPLWSMI